MPIADNDPRVFFAAERTLLAWLRTGLTAMAFGFVIARFGLFVKLMAVQAPSLQHDAHSGWSALLGIVFVLAGSVAVLAATIQYRRFIGTLVPQDLPPVYSGGFAQIAALLTGALGLLLAVYLAISGG